MQNLTNIPKHIAIIMDGNGRWAKKKFLSRTLGHRAGVNALREIFETAANIGVKYLTLYAFSTENWIRPKDEVSALMQILAEYLEKEALELHRNNVKINAIGDISRFSKILQDEIASAIELTKLNDGLTVSIALNYGGRDELVRSVKKICNDVKEDRVKIQTITEELFSNYLDTAKMPDVDLLIRTSGEYRISNFLIWQSAYAELWFTDVLWPDFKGKHLIEAINDYHNRDRRFGSSKGAK
ncbi:MAG: isoprenyl transferase [Alkaliphilus sp.]